MSARAAERRQALLTLAIVAFGKRDFPRAEQLQKQVLHEARQASSPNEIALALYNLANVYIETERSDTAVDLLIEAAEGCDFHGLSELAPLVYTNLGIAFHRCDQFEHAFQSLKIARDLFRLRQNLPAEAYVCDCLATIYHELGRREVAEQSWLYAIRLYDQISYAHLEDVRQSGRKSIEEKLKHHGYLAHGQT